MWVVHTSFIIWLNWILVYIYTLHYVALHYIIRYITSNSLYKHNIDTQWHTHVCVYMYNCLNIIIEHVSSNKSQQIILLYVIFDTLGQQKYGMVGLWYWLRDTTWPGIYRRGKLCPKWVILRVGSDSYCGIIIYNIYITHHERNIIWCTVRIMNHH